MAEEDRRKHLSDLQRKGILEDALDKALEGWVQVRGPDGEPLPYPYEVSADGRVRRREAPRRYRELEPYDSGGGERYDKVALRAEGEPRKQVFVHQLVAWAHVQGDALGMAVDHRNGDPRDNRAENLRYVSPQDEPKIPMA